MPREGPPSLCRLRVIQSPSSCRRTVRTSRADQQTKTIEFSAESDDDKEDDVNTEMLFWADEDPCLRPRELGLE